MPYDHQAQITLQLWMMDYLMIEGNVWIARLDLLKARQIVAGDFPIVGFGPSRPMGTRPLVQVTQMGITTELADQVHLQCTDAIDELLFAEIAIRDQVLERLELLRRHDAFTMGQIGIDTALLRIVVQRRGGLFHAEHIGAVCVTSTQASVAISKPST